MKQQSDHAAEQAALYLQQMGLRPSTKGYQYLNFALMQLLQGTPFQSTIWELTAIYFGQTRKNVMACVRREIARALSKCSDWPIDNKVKATFQSTLSPDDFLRLSVYMIGHTIYTIENNKK